MDIKSKASRKGNHSPRRPTGGTPRKIKSFSRALLKNKRLISGGALLIAVTLIFWVVNSPSVVGVSAAARKLPIYCVRRDNKTASLTFDAAWGNEDTGHLIEILGKYNIRATFFVVGDWVQKYPESVKQLADAGHEVMNHSNDHAHFNKLSAEQITANVDACNDKIEAVTGVRPHLFRPPYGEYNDNVVSTLTGMGMFVIQWDCDSLDWKDLSAAEITRRVLGGVSSGSIVLVHNAAKHTPEALPGIIEALLADGFELVPVSELILSGEYEMDHTGRQIPKN